MQNEQKLPEQANDIIEPVEIDQNITSKTELSNKALDYINSKPAFVEKQKGKETLLSKLTRPFGMVACAATVIITLATIVACSSQTEPKAEKLNITTNKKQTESNADSIDTSSDYSDSEIADDTETTDTSDASNSSETPKTPETTNNTNSNEASTETKSEKQPYAEILEQTTSLEAMDAMSIDEFAGLPYADRAAYVYEKMPDMPCSTIEKELDPANIVEHYQQKLKNGAISLTDTTEGAKVLGAYIYYSSNEDGSINNNFKTNTDETVANGGGKSNADYSEYVTSGEVQDGIDRDGNKIKFINITYNLMDSTTDADVKLSTHTDQIAIIPIKLDDGRTIVAYPSLYTIEGQQSPDPVYPY